MKTEENFYDIINTKFSDRQVPFDEENWQSMRKMIDDSRSEKKRAIWLVISVCLLLFTGAAFGVYEWSNNVTGKQYTMAGNNNPVVNSTQTTTDVTKQTPGQGTTLKSGGGPNTNESGNLTTASASNASAKYNSKPGPIVNNNISNKISKKKYIGISNNKKNTLDNNAAGSLASAADNANNTGKGAPVINEQSNPATGKAASAQSSGKISMPSNSIAVKSTTYLAKASSHKTDSAVAGDGLPQRFSDEPRVFQGKINIFSVEVGADYSFGWAVNSDGTMSQGQGLNYNVGLGYEHYMGSKLFLKTGIQFSTFGDMHTATYNYQHSVGNVIYDSVITTRRLYFLRIPLEAEYFIGRNKKSSVGGGGSVWFLVGNSGYATTYQQGENTPPMNVVQYSQNASLNGYSKVDFSGQMFYKYMINHKFSTYFSIYKEFTSMREESFFGGNITDNTLGCQVSLSYNLN